MVFCKNCEFVAKGPRTPDKEWNCIKSRQLNFQTEDVELGLCRVKNWSGICEDYAKRPDKS